VHFCALSLKFNFLDPNLTFANSVLLEKWMSEATKNAKEIAIFNYMKSAVRGPCSEHDKEVLAEKSKIICYKISDYWLKAKRNLNQFKRRHSSWLSSQTEISIKKRLGSVGRPALTYLSKRHRSQRKEASDLASFKAGNVRLLIQAASAAARKRAQPDLAYVLKLLALSPEKAKFIRKVLSEPIAKPTKVSANEALALLLDQGLTKQQYVAVREQTKNNIYPLYKEVADQKKNCRPSELQISETKAEVPLQNLLDHTAARIASLQEEVFLSLMKEQGTDFLAADLILSYGFDGSSGQSTYKQGYSSEQPFTADSSIFATTVTPLRLIDASTNILWNNKTPQSIRFCRPLKLAFMKETKDSILNESEYLKRQIDKLQSCKIILSDGKFVYIKFRLYLTVIDGKVLNALTGTNSSQACPICGATPKDFLNNKNFKCEKFLPIMKNLHYGLSPLHCWIRLFEFVLHAGYKCQIRKWRISNENDKRELARRKSLIQDLFWKLLSLKVDQPKVGGFGSTNDGNTARRAFSEPETFSEITGIDLRLIKNLRTILICLSSQLPIDVTKFQSFCHKTAEIIVYEYSWLPMTATVHKILVHSADIIQNTVLPVGYFGEEGAESRNKIYKSDRLHHARKCSRKLNFTDVFQRAMDTSDPIISSINLNRRLQKKLNLPSEVIQLLSCEFKSTGDLEDDDVENNFLGSSWDIQLENEGHDQ